MTNSLLIRTTTFYKWLSEHQPLTSTFYKQWLTMIKTPTGPLVRSRGYVTSGVNSAGISNTKTLRYVKIDGLVFEPSLTAVLVYRAVCLGLPQEADNDALPFPIYLIRCWNSKFYYSACIHSCGWRLVTPVSAPSLLACHLPRPWAGPEPFYNQLPSEWERDNDL